MTNSPHDEHTWKDRGRGRMDGKVAVVTAADSGIGRATARLFAHEGAKVVCVDMAERGEPRIDQLIHDDGGEAVFLLGDVSTRETCELMVATAIKKFGELHVLFLNAGTGTRAPLHETSEEQWHHVVSTNLDGIYQGVNAALPHFMAEGRGNIIATSSALGVLGSPNYPAYSATKAGIINLTRVLAVDYGPAIRVNCVCPGPIETNRVREYPPRPRPLTSAQIEEMGTHAKALQRMGKPEEVAYAVLFLASDESSYVTGHALVVDGGLTIAP